MGKIISLIKSFLSIKELLKIGFLTNYVSLDSIDRDYLLNEEFNKDYVSIFEDLMSKEFGDGNVVAFASGRMGFYSILEALSIGTQDEVIMTGFSCSVMANAILKIGAKPVYVDIDRETLGTCPLDLERKITTKTKVVVAQHTFGLPCKIDQICAICKKHGLFLVEDCALTLGSSFKGIKLGDWGDATIFSTDHSKPLNSLIGGGVYTKNPILYAKIREIQNKSGCLTNNQIVSLINSYIKESKYQNQSKIVIVWTGIKRILDIIIDKFLRINRQPFNLTNDFSSCISKNRSYPYPAKMPQQLAYLAIRSLDDYKKNIINRKKFAEAVTSIVSSYECVPSVFFDSAADIVPLRVPYILTHKAINDYCFLNKNWIWFKKPIVATGEDLENFGYHQGDCKIAELVGRSIMNIPIYYDRKKQQDILKHLNRIYK